MHEYSIIQSLASRVEDEVRARGALSVHRVRVALGELSGVDPELLASAWEIFRTATATCGGASLEIRPVAARWACPGCGRPIASGEILRCPDCHRPARLDAGDEILLEQIEMEVA